MIKQILVSLVIIYAGSMLFMFLNWQLYTRKKGPNWCCCKQYNLKGLQLKYSRVDNVIHKSNLCAPSKEMIF